MLAEERGIWPRWTQNSWGRSRSWGPWAASVGWSRKYTCIPGGDEVYQFLDEFRLLLACIVAPVSLDSQSGGKSFNPVPFAFFGTYLVELCTMNHNLHHLNDPLMAPSSGQEGTDLTWWLPTTSRVPTPSLSSSPAVPGAKESVGTFALHFTIENLVHIAEIAGVGISWQNGEDSKSLNNDPYAGFFLSLRKPLMCSAWLRIWN